MGFPLDIHLMLCFKIPVFKNFDGENLVVNKIFIAIIMVLMFGCENKEIEKKDDRG